MLVSPRALDWCNFEPKKVAVLMGTFYMDFVELIPFNIWFG